MDPGYFDIERKQNPKEKANIFSKACYWYTRDVFRKGRRGQLSISDVYRCTEGHRAAPRGDFLADRWRRQLKATGEGDRTTRTLRSQASVVIRGSPPAYDQRVMLGITVQRTKLCRCEVSHESVAVAENRHAQEEKEGSRNVKPAHYITRC
ncbi:Probable multidrug resistance-associated protein lethal(2)03659 [Eumeta japonica]|uniref:Probable multidrug resistance-associated protein lethal(2)03659 n=1 Tax=Eumeta variegata TaxID=151549 RepID=A0A4C1XVF6_EUMVA|nr:Probable multidrug resistance-associated protein lethal(2)03659 [Eumeta japonica]